MRQRLSALTVICMAATIAGSAVAAYIAARIAAEPERHSHPHQHQHADAKAAEAGTSGTDLHAWMHEQLAISDEQHARLAPFESAFNEASQQLNLEISTAERELAALVHSQSRDQARIDGALQRLDQAHAHLRRLTLDHFFTMQQHLDPEQAERLRQWTHDSLIRQLRSRN